MKRVSLPLNSDHPFFKDYDNKLREQINAGKVCHPMTSEMHKNYVKEWYGYDIDINPFGTDAIIYMSDKQYTLFILRWS